MTTHEPDGCDSCDQARALTLPGVTRETAPVGMFDERTETVSTEYPEIEEQRAARAVWNKQHSELFQKLNRRNKADLCTLYRQRGYVGSLHPLESWRKDEIINSIIETEIGIAPKVTLLQPPCDTCGGGANIPDHGRDGDHNYSYTARPGTPWVPEDTPARRSSGPCTCGAAEDPDGETMCVCDAMEAENGTA